MVKNLIILIATILIGCSTSTVKLDAESYLNSFGENVLNTIADDKHYSSIIPSMNDVMEMDKICEIDRGEDYKLIEEDSKTEIKLFKEKLREIRVKGEEIGVNWSTYEYVSLKAEDITILNENLKKMNLSIFFCCNEDTFILKLPTVIKINDVLKILDKNMEVTQK